ncbi:MAG: hypothetical protein F7C33_01785 [Desulfurococcales archaeon]|nr:hypothetical protein [Desulfurococcales archaeon]
MAGRARTQLGPLEGELLLKAANVLYEKCMELGLSCRDPPLATSRFLYSLGFTQYRIRKLWSALSKQFNYHIIIYKYRNSVFKLALTYERGPASHLYLGGLYLPIDDIDASQHSRMGIVRSPKAHKVYAYIEGEISEHISININIIRILVLLGRSGAQSLIDSMLHEVKGVLWGRGRNLENILLDLIKYKNIEILEVLLPKVPRSKDELYKLSPALRRILHR